MDREAKTVCWGDHSNTGRILTRRQERQNCECVNLDGVSALGILELNKSIFDSQFIHTHTAAGKLSWLFWKIARLTANLIAKIGEIILSTHATKKKDFRIAMQKSIFKYHLCVGVNALLCRLIWKGCGVDKDIWGKKTRLKMLKCIQYLQFKKSKVRHFLPTLKCNPLGRFFFFMVRTVTKINLGKLCARHC